MELHLWAQRSVRRVLCLLGPRSSLSEALLDAFSLIYFATASGKGTWQTALPFFSEHSLRWGCRGGTALLQMQAICSSATKTRFSTPNMARLSQEGTCCCWISKVCQVRSSHARAFAVLTTAAWTGAQRRPICSTLGVFWEHFRRCSHVMMQPSCRHGGRHGVAAWRCACGCAVATPSAQGPGRGLAFCGHAAGALQRHQAAAAENQRYCQVFRHACKRSITRKTSAAARRRSA